MSSTGISLHFIVMVSLLGFIFAAVTPFIPVNGLSITTNNSVSCNNGKCTQSTSCEGSACPQNNLEFKHGYATGIMDWNKNGADTSHHFICPKANTDPKGEFCQGYDAALAFMNSDQ